MSAGFEAEWLAVRAPYDEEALDRDAIRLIQAWGAGLPDDHRPVVVDLGSGTGVALDRVRRWLAPRRIVAYAVDQDADLLARITPPDDGSLAVPIVGDLLLPLPQRGGPPDGTVDLLVEHAVADLLPLDRLAERVAALLRPGGLTHLALVYDGLTAFTPVEDGDLEAEIIAAFHRHMDRPARKLPSHGGSTAGRRLGPALAAAGLEIVVDAPSVWQVRADDGPGARPLLDRLIRYVVEAVSDAGGIQPRDLARWERHRRTNLRAGTLTARVGHRDLLVRKPPVSESRSGNRRPPR